MLSTLHTNSAIGTVSRLIDMGAPGYLIATALQAVQQGEAVAEARTKPYGCSVKYAD